MPTLHSVSKNVPPLACYTFERILILFGRNVTDKVGNQKTLYYATLSNLCFCTTWQNGETQKSHFHSAGLCYTQCTCALSSSKKKLSSAMCLIASNICWDSISLILSIYFHSRLDEEQLPSFTQRLTPWQSWLIQIMWVTNSRMLCSLPRSCVVYPADRFDSEGWFSSDQVIFLTMFCVLWKVSSAWHENYINYSNTTKINILFIDISASHRKPSSRLTSVPVVSM